MHDWLNTKEGGAEQVLYELLKLYPLADLTTLVFDRDKFGAKIGNRRVKTSFLQYFPQFLRRRPQLLLPFVRLAVNSINTEGYDIVLASSSAWVKNSPLKGSTKMLVYCYSPARMLWDYWPRALRKRSPSPLVRAYVTWLASRLRLWDFYTSQESRRKFVAISATVGLRIYKYYRRESQLIYPPVHIPPVAATDRSENYIIVSVLAPYKNIELAIEAFRGTKRKLLIAGDGPDRQRLEELAGNSPNIRFLGRVSQADKFKLLSAARGFVFCSVEDFGITPVEAIASGAPVIALRGGGVAETMVEHVTAEFFDSTDKQALRAALERAETNSWDRAKMHRRAKLFSYERFKVDIATALEKMV
jgi:glycosyltransferase involved in cell wall biosynthesis